MWVLLGAGVVVLLVILAVSCAAPTPIGEESESVLRELAEELGYESIEEMKAALQGGSEPDGTHSPVPVGSTPTPAIMLTPMPTGTPTSTPTATPTPTVNPTPTPLTGRCKAGSVVFDGTLDPTMHYGFIVDYRLYEPDFTDPNVSWPLTVQAGGEWEIWMTTHPLAVVHDIAEGKAWLQAEGECAPPLRTMLIPTPTPYGPITGQCEAGAVVFDGEIDRTERYLFYVGDLEIALNFSNPSIPWPFHVDAKGQWEVWQLYGPNFFGDKLLASGWCAEPASTATHDHVSPPSICDVVLSDGSVPYGCPSPPIVASKAAWDCYFDHEDLDDAPYYETTRCGWPPHFLYTYVKRAPVNWVIATGEIDEEWSRALTSALNQLSALTGVEWKLWDENLDTVLEVEFRDADSILDCGPPELQPTTDTLGCSYSWFHGDDKAVPTVDGYVHGGKIAIAVGNELTAEEKVGVLLHELIHQYGFAHTPDGSNSIMAVGEYHPAPNSLTEQDKEMLRLYALLPIELFIEEVRERACIGRDGVCEHMYAGG